ncbi:hypothetical protein ACRBEV_32625 (plasmid) [Methylobacterium phyllosphaerae]
MTVVQRVENSPGEPVITIAQLNALLQTLRAAGASFPAAETGHCDNTGQR